MIEIRRGIYYSTYQGKWKIVLHIGADDLNDIYYWVDASYGTHGELKGQKRATISIGKGSVTSMSNKQKTNTTSSTIRELVGVHN